MADVKHFDNRLIIVWVMVIVLLLAGCSAAGPEESGQPSSAADVTSTKGDSDMSFTLTSTAFEAGGAIPVRYSCVGQDISPPLRWTEPPQATESLALIVDDPDAPIGTFTHWVMYNIPASVQELPEAMAADKELENGTRQGNNSAHQTGYKGPCPPSGTHRYFFRLFALDTKLDLPANADKKQLESAMQEHVLAQTELMGTFAKP